MKNPCQKILLIEEAADAERIRDIAESRGTECVVVAPDRLSSARGLLREGAFDAVLLGLTPLGSKGLETLHCLFSEGPLLPIIVLTINPDKDLAAQAIAMGAQDCLIKERIDADQLYRSMIYAIERKRAEKALRESEEKYREFVQNANSAVVTTDRDGAITFFNEYAQTLFGYRLDEIVGQNLKILVSPKETGSGRDLKEMIDNILNDTNQFPENVNENVRKNGERVWVSWRNRALRDVRGDLIGNLSIGQDITERKRAEEALQERDRQMSRAEEIAHLGSWELDVVNNRLSWSDEVYRIFGLRPQEFGATYEAFLDAVHPEDRSAVDDAYSGSLREGRDAYEIEHRVVRRSTGEVRVVHEKCEHIRDGSGRIIRSVGMVHDITESRRTQEALRESEHKLRLFIEHAPAAVAMFDREMRYVAVSRRWLSNYNLVGANVIGRSHYELFPEMPERWKEVHRRCLAGATEKAENDPFPRLSGAIEWVNWEILPWYEQNGGVGGLILLVEDVTRRKKTEDALKKAHDELEERVQERTGELQRAYEKLRAETAQREHAEARLRQGQKMETIGTFAGGIAHDFNNLLAIIIGNTELALDELPKDGIRHNLMQIFKASKRGRDLVKQILTFSRRSDKMRKPVEIAPLLKETFELLRSSISTNVEMSLDMEVSDVAVFSMPSDIQQIIMNLASNAEHAMRGGGTLAFRLTERTYPSGDDLPEADMEPGAYVALTVSDTGTGMTAGMRKRIFDPFFTTKEVGEGTGMGLAVVYGIVKDLDGGITVSSRPGKGTTFHVFLPKAVPGREEQHEEAGSPRGGEERILFVDDEEAIAEATRTIARAPRLSGDGDHGRRKGPEPVPVRPDEVRPDNHRSGHASHHRHQAGGKDAPDSQRHPHNPLYWLQSFSLAREDEGAWDQGFSHEAHREEGIGRDRKAGAGQQVVVLVNHNGLFRNCICTKQIFLMWLALSALTPGHFIGRRTREE